MKTPVSLRNIKKEVAELASDIASPVVEAVKKRVGVLDMHDLLHGGINVPPTVSHASHGLVS